MSSRSTDPGVDPRPRRSLSLRPWWWYTPGMRGFLLLLSIAFPCEPKKFQIIGHTILGFPVIPTFMRQVALSIVYSMYHDRSVKRPFSPCMRTYFVLLSYTSCTGAGKYSIPQRIPLFVIPLLLRPDVVCSETAHVVVQFETEWTSMRSGPGMLRK